AMTMADRVATMSRGLVQQAASPAELYAKPTNLFVAGFIGSPPMNLFDGVVARVDGALGVRFGTQWLELPESEAVTNWEGCAVVIGIRPEDVEDAVFDSAAPQTRRLRLPVDLVEQLGSDVLVHVLTDATAAQGAQLADAAEDSAQIANPTVGARLLARCNPRSRIARGDVVEFTVDTERVHLFDPVSGNAL
ncbi:MAG: TOBE domain-containing protein, partial [Actinomycetota bacterium]